MKTFDKLKTYVGKTAILKALSFADKRYNNIEVHVHDINTNNSENINAVLFPVDPDSLNRNIREAWDKDNVFMLRAGNAWYWDLELLKREWDDDENIYNS